MFRLKQEYLNNLLNVNFKHFNNFNNFKVIDLSGLKTSIYFS